MKKTLGNKQKRRIGLGLFAALLLILSCSLFFVLKNREELFSVDTGVDSSQLTGDAQTLTVG